jgi:endo-1,4-beta-xylanase
MKSLVPILVLLLFAVPVSAQDRFFGNIWKGSDDSYFGTLFDQITPENAGKWGSLEPSNDDYLWSSLDNMYNVAENKNLKTKQHCLPTIRPICQSTRSCFPSCGNIHPLGA